MKILVVEDDPLLSQDIITALQAAGHKCDHIDRGDWAQSYLLEDHENSNRFDMVILDLGLPEKNGIEVLKYWRRHNILTPVLILTARDSWQEIVDGLNSGADDYLCKPFHMLELLARLEALRRRDQQQGHTQLQAAGIYLDEDKQQACLESGECLTLTATEFSMLKTLMLHSGKMVSKQLLLESCYDWQEEKSENLVEVYIRKLRKKLGKQAITTYRGQGYMLGER
ncbi:transcriptional regulator [Oleispira antarctica RB-8]|uniref:Transcriptional regulator n=1 Tax=Oleispira antarctica RB-8 TaxID=698738 RepID=R4YS42_OLEAN|nr:transcriptional regulator [Oleispira antarctica RB-8]